MRWAGFCVLNLVAVLESLFRCPVLCYVSRVIHMLVSVFIYSKLLLKSIKAIKKRGVLILKAHVAFVCVKYC